MTEPATEAHAQASAVPHVDGVNAARAPFVSPRVEDLGGLSDLTLLGGSL